MDINQLLNELKETYSFSNAAYTQTPGETMTDFVFCPVHPESRPPDLHRRILRKYDQHLRTRFKRYLNGNYHPLYGSKRAAYPHL